MTKRKTFIVWVLASAGGLLLLLIGVALVIVQTDWFRNYVKQAIVSATEDAIGGKVEIGAFSFSTSSLHAVVTDFVIHGSEPAGAAPFLKASRVELYLRVFTNLHHFLDVVYLGVEKPQANIMVFADGRTNIPVPKKPTPSSNAPPLQSVVDLAVGRFNLSDGLVVFNEAKQRFNFQGNNLRAELWFNPLKRSYSGQLGMEPIYVVSGRNTPVHLRVTLPVTVESNRVTFMNASIATDASNIAINGFIDNLRNPKVSAHLNGHIALIDVKNAGNVPLTISARGVPSTMDLDASTEASGDSIQVSGLRLSLGESTMEASGPLKDLKGTGALQFKTHLALGQLGRLANVTAKPDGMLAINGLAKYNSAESYQVTGNLQANRLSFVQGRQRITGIDANSAFHVDPHAIELQALKLGAFGGEFRGDISLEDFAQYKLNGNLAHLDIQTLAQVFGEKLPYDGLISGRVTAAGDVKSNGTKGITAETRLIIGPGRRGIPMSGKLDAHYNGMTNSVVVANSYLALPHTRLTLDGSLNNRLNVTLTSRDLNDLMAAASPGTKSPVVFNGGQATFAGTVAGNLTNPRLAGHLDVSRFAAEGRQFQDLAADVTVSSSQATLRNGALERASTKAEFSASLGLRQWKPVPKAPITADATVHSSDLGDLAALAGVSSNGYSGALTVVAHVNGTQGNPRGSVNVQASNGTLVGNAFDRISLEAKLDDRVVTIPAAYISSGASRVNLTGEFQHPPDSFTTGHVHMHVKSNQIDLAQVKYLQQTQRNSGGIVQLDVDATGDLTERNEQTEFLLASVNGDVSAKAVRFEGQTYGDLTAAAHTSGNVVTYNVTSDFAGSDLRVNGNTQLIADYPTTADAKISRLPVERVLAAAKQTGIPARGSLSGTAHFSGTAEHPTGKVDLDLANAVVYDEPLDHVRAAVNYLPNVVEVSRFEVAAGSQRIDLTGRFDHPPDDLKSGTVQFKVDGTRIDLARVRNVQKLGTGISGSLQIAADGVATLRAADPMPLFTRLNADIGATQLTVQHKLLGNATLKAGTSSGNRLTFALESNLAGATLHGEGNAQLTSEYPLDARLTFTNLNYAGLQPLINSGTGAPPAFDAVTDGMVTVNGPATKTDQLRGSLRLTRLAVDTKPRPGITRTVGIRNEGPIELSLDRGTIRVASAHVTGPQTDIQASGTASLTQQTSNLNVNARVDLALLQTLDPEIISSGALVANATVRGALAHPQMIGNVELQKASFNYMQFPNGISNANGVVVLNGANATIRNLEGESGGGKINASGFVSFANNLRFALRARAKAVRFRVQEGMSVVTDADVRLTGTTTASVANGTVTVDQLTYAPRTDIGAMLSRSGTPVQSASPPSPMLEAMKLDVRVRTSPSLGVQAAMAENLQASADLQVRGTAANPAVLGRVNITEGQLVFFGSTYTVNSGTIGFYNPLRIEPVLNVSLETQAKGVGVTLTVTGPIDNMKLTYTSDPPLQFEEIVGLLASGKTPTSDPTLLANQPQQPSQSFAQMGESAIVSKAIADPVSNRLQRVFGITQLKIDPAFTSGSQLPTARLTFQQQISTNVTFTYTSALDDPNSTIIRAEWAFNPQYSAVATRDQNGLVSILLFYKRQFR